MQHTILHPLMCAWIYIFAIKVDRGSAVASVLWLFLLMGNRFCRVMNAFLFLPEES